MIYVLAGKSAAGKDSFFNYLLERKDLKPIVSYTSRPMREGETEGKDYNFRSKERMLEKISKKELLEYRSYETSVNGIHDTWYYGSPKVNPKEDWIVVLDMEGLKSYREAYGPENITAIYLACPEDIREERARRRGSFDKTEWDRRAADDSIKFQNATEECNISFDTYSQSFNEILRDLEMLKIM